MDAPLSPNFRHLTGKPRLKEQHQQHQRSISNVLETPHTSSWPSSARASRGSCKGRAHAVTGVPAEEMVIFEQAGGFGGVWHTNTYSGAACDIASHI